MVQAPALEEIGHRLLACERGDESLVLEELGAMRLDVRAFDDPAHLAEHLFRMVEVALKRADVTDIEARGDLTFGLVDLMEMIPGALEFLRSGGHVPHLKFEHAQVVRKDSRDV